MRRTCLQNSSFLLVGFHDCRSLKILVLDALEMACYQPSRLFQHAKTVSRVEFFSSSVSTNLKCFSVLCTFPFRTLFTSFTAKLADLKLMFWFSLILVFKSPFRLSCLSPALNTILSQVACTKLTLLLSVSLYCKYLTIIASEKFAAPTSDRSSDFVSFVVSDAALPKA